MIEPGCYRDTKAGTKQARRRSCKGRSQSGGGQGSMFPDMFIDENMMRHGETLRITVCTARLRLQLQMRDAALQMVKVCFRSRAISGTP